MKEKYINKNLTKFQVSQIVRYSLQCLQFE